MFAEHFRRTYRDPFQPFFELSGNLSHKADFVRFLTVHCAHYEEYHPWQLRTIEDLFNVLVNMHTLSDLRMPLCTMKSTCGWGKTIV